MISSHGGCIGIVFTLLEHGAEVNQVDVSNLNQWPWASCNMFVTIKNNKLHIFLGLWLECFGLCFSEKSCGCGELPVGARG